MAYFLSGDRLEISGVAKAVRQTKPTRVAAGNTLTTVIWIPKIIDCRQQHRLSFVGGGAVRQFEGRWPYLTNATDVEAFCGARAIELMSDGAGTLVFRGMGGAPHEELDRIRQIGSYYFATVRRPRSWIVRAGNHHGRCFHLEGLEIIGR